MFITGPLTLFYFLALCHRLLLLLVFCCFSTSGCTMITGQSCADSGGYWHTLLSHFNLVPLTEHVRAPSASASICITISSSDLLWFCYNMPALRMSSLLKCCPGLLSSLNGFSSPRLPLLESSCPCN
ncbi:hypothetical protein M404DRAFT_487173 [Pisolithus tinctorius Marx 270]|uniref:Secreted protein n=1 Tax=Pisolithus tinctorius Marx 270 TaxID=870435 RepID=A0A0C3MXN1_PISTI|nr:hypothetical protein M404DRAFT_487173 [Pisolithus tinctorius Marx 270]